MHDQSNGWPSENSYKHLKIKNTWGVGANVLENGAKPYNDA